jgi:hypothetical protein
MLRAAELDLLKFVTFSQPGSKKFGIFKEQVAVIERMLHWPVNQRL